jgi:hypothetical protein
VTPDVAPGIASYVEKIFDPLEPSSQLGKMSNVLFSVTMNAHGVDSGHGNANKTGVRFGWAANGGFLG